MNNTSRFAWAGGLLTTSLPAWAAQATPGIDPTLFVIGVAGAFAAGVAVGYAVGKSSSNSDQSNSNG
jgi:hypothetical protein